MHVFPAPPIEPPWTTTFRHLELFAHNERIEYYFLFWRYLTPLKRRPQNSFTIARNYRSEITDISVHLHINKIVKFDFNIPIGKRSWANKKKICQGAVFGKGQGSRIHISLIPGL
ncbi:Uncharacterised protein r2_g74 [Pycnogonum litorale]